MWHQGKHTHFEKLFKYEHIFWVSPIVKLWLTNPSPVRCTPFCVPWLKAAFSPGGNGGIWSQEGRGFWRMETIVMSSYQIEYSRTTGWTTQHYWFYHSICHLLGVIPRFFLVFHILFIFFGSYPKLHLVEPFVSYQKASKFIPTFRKSNPEKLSSNLEVLGWLGVKGSDYNLRYRSLQSREPSGAANAICVDYFVCICTQRPPLKIGTLAKTEIRCAYKVCPK